VAAPDGIERGRAGRGVVEDAPDGRVLGTLHKLAGQPVKGRVVVGVIVHARGAMKPKIAEPGPAARRVRLRDRWWVGGHTRHLPGLQQAIRLVPEPAWMAWLADDLAPVTRT